MASWVAEDSPEAAPAAAAPPAGKGWVAEQPTTWADTANDFGRAVTNAATFGMGNRAKAYIEYLKGNAPSYSEGVDAQAKASEVARERSPAASIAGDVYGSFAIPSLGAGRAAASMGGGALARAGAYGGTGAVTGALQGAGNTYSGEAGDYAKNALMGGVLGGVLGGAGGAAFGAGPARSAARVPDAAEQAVARDAAYDTLRSWPARYRAPAFAQRADEVTSDLRRGNYYNAASTEGGSPRTFRTVEQMRAPPTAVSSVNGQQRLFVSPGDIDQVRKGVTGDRISGATPTDQASARIVRRNIDDFIQNPPPGAVAPGTETAARQASNISRTAHELHGGFKRTQMMEDLISNARDTAGATHSGLNLRNELQKAVRSRLALKEGENQFTKAGYIPAETAALQRFARGQGPVSRGLGYVDKYLGGGGGLGALAATTAAGSTANSLLKDDPEAGALYGGAAGAVGLGLRLLGNRRAAGQIQSLTDMIGQRNPLYRARAATAPTVPGPGSPATAKAVRDAVTNAIIQQNKDLPRVYVNEPD